MTANLNTPYSDLVSGYVTSFNRTQDSFTLKTSDNQEVIVLLTPTVFAELLRNLGEAYQDATGILRDLLISGRYLSVYGIFYADAKGTLEAKHIIFFGRNTNDYRFEEQNWWIRQIGELANFYLEAEFGTENGKEVIDYSQYRTNLTSTGSKQKLGRQETDTISRLIYGFASAYMYTGDSTCLEAAVKGSEYLQEHLCFRDAKEGICFWYHAVDIRPDGTERKIYASEFGDDFDAIPCYEQIYALAGLTQTYRITGDPKFLKDIEATIRLFNRYFKDPSEKGGYYSHIDPITFSPHSESLGKNQARKNWNSVGDHAPAYLINLYLATEKDEYADFLEYTFDTICAHFPDYDNSSFIQEKFLDDWTPDRSWGWQQNRAVVGHNLKIAWNLTRMYSLKAKDSYRQLAEKIGQIIPTVGCDRQRGGWYDVMERALEPGQTHHRLVWHDRKAWWQQEQGILAYYIMAGVYGDNSDYLRFAREGTAFYNAWFLDTEMGGVYFNVLANGLPYALGTEREKGSHSMAGYHSFELCFLGSVYNNLLIKKEPLDLFFSVKAGAFSDNLLRVAPDILPPGSIKLDAVWVSDKSYLDFDRIALTVNLPDDFQELNIRVRISAIDVDFDADLLALNNEKALISLIGTLNDSTLKYLKEELERAHEAKVIILDASQLTAISDEALRYLDFYRQKAGDGFEISFINASEYIRESIANGEF